MVTPQIESESMTQIRELQKAYIAPWKIVQQVKEEKESNFRVGNARVLQHQKRLCIPSKDKLRTKILKEAYHNSYSIYPSCTKMYQDLMQHQWLSGMKANITKYIARYLNCQQVKVKHKKPRGLLNPIF